MSFLDDMKEMIKHTDDKYFGADKKLRDTITDVTRNMVYDRVYDITKRHGKGKFTNAHDWDEMVVRHLFRLTNKPTVDKLTSSCRAYVEGDGVPTQYIHNENGLYHSSLVPMTIIHCNEMFDVESALKASYYQLGLDANVWEDVCKVHLLNYDQYDRMLPYDILTVFPVSLKLKQFA